MIVYVDGNGRAHSEVRQRKGMLAIRVNEDEEQRIRAAARRRGVSVAALLRESALAAADVQVTAPELEPAPGGGRDA